MKRTAEIVMAVIAVIISGLTALVGLLMNFGMSDPEFLRMVEEEAAADPAAQGVDMAEFMDLVALAGPIWIAVGLISLVLGVIGIIAIKGNKKPVLAGVMLILAAVVIGIGTFGVGFIPALLFLIAGIMAFARKPKVTEQPYI
ncbi:DUF4064 domain-containing protein [Sutcliffiella horikoshii]|uniref:DUF4064 domain-containing protein n=1 Tax=Sutcliffiella horikoshii TaxID=79883 RepID=UPI0007D0735B|nr:DUF4064 domain-containing protein [Sutcliffiella horikoshii]MCM3620182.1 DUF4064 domain-containing protein [Sutcliffiella horikoshii]